MGCGYRDQEDTDFAIERHRPPKEIQPRNYISAGKWCHMSEWPWCPQKEHEKLLFYETCKFLKCRGCLIPELPGNSPQRLDQKWSGGHSPAEFISPSAHHSS